MNKKIYAVFTGTVVFAALVFHPGLYAGPSDHRAGNGEGKGEWQEKGRAMFRDLDLTEEQRERLRTRREEKEETYQQAREQLKSLRAALGDELDKPEADQGKTDELVRQITSLQQQMLTERVDSILEMKEILTPEQFEKMAQKRKQMRENRGEFGRERMKRRPMDARAMQIGSGQIDPVTPEEEAGDS